jgi:hypothetical protein
MNKTTATILVVLAIAGGIGYWYYKRSLPDFMPVTESDAEDLSKITLE